MSKDFSRIRNSRLGNVSFAIIYGVLTYFLIRQAFETGNLWMYLFTFIGAALTLLNIYKSIANGKNN